MLPPIHLPQDFEEAWAEYLTQTRLRALFFALGCSLTGYYIYRLANWIERQVPMRIRLLVGVNIWLCLMLLQWQVFSPWIMSHLEFTTLDFTTYVPESYNKRQSAKVLYEFSVYLLENQQQIDAEIILTGRLEYCLEHEVECTMKVYDRWRDEQPEELLDRYPG